jgi:hypothetical protein
MRDRNMTLFVFMIYINVGNSGVVMWCDRTLKFFVCKKPEYVPNKRTYDPIILLLRKDVKARGMRTEEYSVIWR